MCKACVITEVDPSEPHLRICLLDSDNWRPTIIIEGDSIVARFRVPSENLPHVYVKFNDASSCAQFVFNLTRMWLDGCRMCFAARKYYLEKALSFGTTKSVVSWLHMQRGCGTYYEHLYNSFCPNRTKRLDSRLRVTALDIFEKVDQLRRDTPKDPWKCLECNILSAEMTVWENMISKFDIESLITPAASSSKAEHVETVHSGSPRDA